MSKSCPCVASFPLLLLPLLGSCGLLAAPVAAAPVRTPAPSPAASAPVADDPNPVDAALGPQDAAANPAPAVASRAQEPAASEASLAFWKSADFQLRFAESYLAESDYEPKVTARERDLLVEVAELLATAGTTVGDDPKSVQDRAIALLTKRVDPTSSAALYFMLGSLQFQRDRLPEAAVAYETAVGKHASFRRAWKNLSLVQVRTANWKDATRALTKTVQLGGADALTYGLLGFALANADDQIGAESAYRMAAMLDPTTVDYRLGLARAFFKQRRFADAASLTGTLITATPDRADLWLLQANAYAGMNELGKAAENLELVDRLGQATADSLHLLGDIYTNQDLPDLAASAYLRAIARDQKGDTARALRAAKALAARGCHGECQQLVDAIDKAYGDKLDAAGKKELLKLRARLAVAKGAGDEQAAVLEQVVALDPLDGEAVILLGQYHARRGEPDLAILQYERAAGIPAFEADAKVRHAQLLVGQSRHAEALPLLRRAQQIKPRENVQQFLDQVERIATGR